MGSSSQESQSGIAGLEVEVGGKGKLQAMQISGNLWIFATQTGVLLAAANQASQHRVSVREYAGTAQPTLVLTAEQTRTCPCKSPLFSTCSTFVLAA